MESKPTELFDTHAHLDDEQLFDNAQEVIERARTAGVATVVSIGTTAESSQRCVDLADKYHGIYAAVGIQPNYCAEAQPGDWQKIIELTNHTKVVAIGETGLDCYWDYAPLPLQEDYFRRHVQLSRQTNLPFIVHMRESAAEILAVLQDQKTNEDFHGVMHSFTGTADELYAFLDLGLYVSFAGMVTFKKSNELRRIAKEVPNDRLLIETDSPYLAPHPKRGQRPNEPALIVHTARCLAECREQDFAEIGEMTTRNARELFGLPLENAA